MSQMLYITISKGTVQKCRFILIWNLHLRTNIIVAKRLPYNYIRGKIFVTEKKVTLIVKPIFFLS